MPVYTNFSLTIKEGNLILGGENAADGGTSCAPRREAVIGVSNRVVSDGKPKEIRPNYYEGLTIRRHRSGYSQPRYLDAAGGRLGRNKTLFLFLTAGNNTQTGRKIGYIEVPYDQNTPIIADAVSSRVIGGVDTLRTWHTTAFKVEPRHFLSVFAVVWYSEDFKKRTTTVLYVVDAVGQVYTYFPIEIEKIYQEVGVKVPLCEDPRQWRRADLSTP